MVGVDDLAGDADAAVLGQRPGQGVLVDYELDAAPGLFLAGLGVHDVGVVVLDGDQVGAAREDGGASLKPEGVLLLDEDVAAVGQPAVAEVVEEGGVGELPLGGVEVRGGSDSVLVMGLEPDGPFAGVVADQEAGEPRVPDVGVSGRCLQLSRK